MHPNLRSTLVVKEFDFVDKDRPGLFAATPPLEVLKSILQGNSMSDEDHTIPNVLVDLCGVFKRSSVRDVRDVRETTNSKGLLKFEHSAYSA